MLFVGLGVGLVLLFELYDAINLIWRKVKGWMSLRFLGNDS
ncbi:hypothetical protein ACT7DE_30620 [Bacillus paranthracis]